MSASMAAASWASLDSSRLMNESSFDWALRNDEMMASTSGRMRRTKAPQALVMEFMFGSLCVGRRALEFAEGRRAVLRDNEHLFRVRLDLLNGGAVAVVIRRIEAVL